VKKKKTKKGKKKKIKTRDRTIKTKSQEKTRAPEKTQREVVGNVNASGKNVRSLGEINKS